MERKYKYTLESYIRTASKHECPGCGQKELTRYVYTDTGNYVADNVGICNRKDKCTYHYPPAQYFKDNPELKKEGKNKVANVDLQSSPKQTSYIPDEIFRRYVSRNIMNNQFIQYLFTHFSEEQLQEVHQRYFFGTTESGAMVYFQIDATGKVRAGKIITYDPETGKRDKSANPPANWVHSICAIQDFHLQQCFFGERLITKFPDKKIAIVESEKTAIICSILYPEWNWLAAGSRDGLSMEKCKVLKGKRVALFPDIDAHSKWLLKAEELQRLASFYVSSFMYDNVPPDQRGKQDIGDFLLLDLSTKPTHELGMPQGEDISSVKSSKILDTIPPDLIALSEHPEKSCPINENFGKDPEVESSATDQSNSELDKVVNDFDEARQKIMDVPFYGTGIPFADFEILNFASICEIVQTGRYKGAEQDNFRFIHPALRNATSTGVKEQNTNFYWPGVLCERSFFQGNKNHYYHNGFCGFNIGIKNGAEQQIDLIDAMQAIALLPNVLLLYRSAANGLVCFTFIGNVSDTREYHDRMVVFSNYVIQKLGNCFERIQNNGGIYRVNHDPDAFLFSTRSKFFNWADFLKVTDLEQNYIKFKDSPHNLFDGSICEDIS